MLSDVLGRIKDEALDPDYVRSETWPNDLAETTTREIFDKLHNKPGSILPKDQTLFEQTVLKGIERGLWVLVQTGHVYTPEDVPSRVVVSLDAQLLVPEEAGRKGVTDQRGHKCKNCLNWPCTCGITQPPPPPTLPPEWKQFEYMKPSSQLEELERWVRREGVEFLSDAEISLRGTSEVAPQFRNLLRLSSAGRRLSLSVKVTLGAENANLQLHCEFHSNEKGLEEDAAKILDDAARWNVSQFEGTITMKTDRWEIDELKDLLRALKSDAGTKIALNLKRVK